MASNLISHHDYGIKKKTTLVHEEIHTFGGKKMNEAPTGMPSMKGFRDLVGEHIKVLGGGCSSIWLFPSCILYNAY